MLISDTNEYVLASILQNSIQSLELQISVPILLSLLCIFCYENTNQKKQSRIDYFHKLNLINSLMLAIVGCINYFINVNLKLNGKMYLFIQILLNFYITYFIHGLNCFNFKNQVTFPVYNNMEKRHVVFLTIFELFLFVFIALTYLLSAMFVTQLDEYNNMYYNWNYSNRQKIIVYINAQCFIPCITNIFCGLLLTIIRIISLCSNRKAIGRQKYLFLVNVNNNQINIALQNNNDMYLYQKEKLKQSMAEEEKMFTEVHQKMGTLTYIKHIHKRNKIYQQTHFNEQMQ